MTTGSGIGNVGGQRIQAQQIKAEQNAGKAVRVAANEGKPVDTKKMMEDKPAPASQAGSKVDAVKMMEDRPAPASKAGTSKDAAAMMEDHPAPKIDKTA